jgi:hypothetical protein
MANFFVTFVMYLGCTTNQRSIPFGGSSGSFAMFSGVFIAEEVDGVGDKGSGDITKADEQNSLRPFWSYHCDLPA